MTRELTARLTDELDGTEVDGTEVDGTEVVETISFGFQGVDYEIDLDHENVEEIERAFGTWIEHSRKLGPSPAPPRSARDPSVPRSRRRGSGEDLAAMRAWARENGYRISARGRVPAEVREAFHDAHR